MAEAIEETGDQQDDAGIGERVGKVEAAVTRIEEALARALGGAHADAARTTEGKLDENSAIAAQVQEELARRDRQRDEDALKGDVAALKETAAKLQEKAPGPPVRRVEKIMGWHG